MNDDALRDKGPQKPYATKLSIREDEAARGSVRGRGANLDSIGFNMTFIAAHDPNLASDILMLYKRAKDLEATVPGMLAHDRGQGSRYSSPKM